MRGKTALCRDILARRIAEIGIIAVRGAADMYVRIALAMAIIASTSAKTQSPLRPREKSEVRRAC